MGDFLYESENVRISLYKHPGEHELQIRYLGGEEEWDRFGFQRGVLRDLALDAKQDYGKLQRRLFVFNKIILVSADRNKVSLDDLAKAFISAYYKEETESSKGVDKEKPQS